MELLMGALMLWASSFTGLPATERLPRIVHMDPCTIEKLYTGEPECTGAMSVEAIYDSGVIMVPDGWAPNTIYGVSLLLHELVHHMQHETGMKMSGNPCPGRNLEKPAYDAQMAFLAAAGLDPFAEMGMNDLALFMVTSCGRDF